MLIFHNLSIKGKFTLIMLLVSSIVLFLASSAFIANDLLMFRHAMATNLLTLADVLGMNSSGTILFNDQKSANENMSALRIKPHILFAHFFLVNNELFASYVKEGIQKSLTLKELSLQDLYVKNIQPDGDRQIQDNYFFHDDYIEVFKNITFEGEIIGTVYIRSDLKEFYMRLRWGLTVVSVVTCISLLLAFQISYRLQNLITKPVYKLLETMQILAKEKDYSIRANKMSNDELGRLIDSFNGMLAQIERRDQELSQYRDHLEEKVNQRTTELAEARDLALAANRAKSTFLANMSHELRTPLNGILGYAQILGRDKTLTEKQREGVKIIQRSGDYLLTLINDILDLSKIEAGRVELYAVDFHFGEFLNSIVSLFRIRAEQKGISFFYELLSHLPVGLHADEKRLRQIIINLLGNAIKFTEHGGVTLKVGYHNGKIRFQVEDTGVGIASEEIDKIFLPFQQLGDSNHKAEGTGLGLPITKTLIEMMGGELMVESTPGQGSVFWTILDLQEATSVILSDKVVAPVIVGFEGYARTILAIDDKWENRSVIVNLLTPVGFTVLEAENGQEGLNKAQTIHPDLIITDLVMPIMDGFEAVRRMRKIENLQNTPIIAASASVFDYHQQQSLDAGCNDFVAKPFAAEELLALIQKYLNLAWIYEDKYFTEGSGKAVTEQKEDEATALVGPSPEQAAILFDLGMMGDIKGILEEADKLELLNKQLRPFLDKIRQLAKGFAEEEICELVQKYM